MAEQIVSLYTLRIAAGSRRGVVTLHRRGKIPVIRTATRLKKVLA
jgi:hypothetical protein